MAGETTNQIQHWTNLKQQAISGELTMEEEVGSVMAKHCNTLLDSLDVWVVRAENLSHLSGYGGLPSALAMKRKFELKAHGSPDGDTAVARIGDLITIVELMRDTYLASIGQLQQTDQGNSQQTQAVGEGLR